MGKEEKSNKQELFMEALRGKKVPILTLDNKWYRILDTAGRETVHNLEEQLNELLKRQGKVNTETRDIKLLKKKLMSEIVPMVDEVDQTSDPKLEKKLEDNKRLIAECNDKLDQYQDEILDLPHQIEELNRQLMLQTMDLCYQTMNENTERIQEITDWVNEIRVELKKRLIRKQEKEQQNHNIYSYMHDIFGADVIDLFDMKYNPEEQHPQEQKATEQNPKQ